MRRPRIAEHLRVHQQGSEQSRREEETNVNVDISRETYDVDCIYQSIIIASLIAYQRSKRAGRIFCR